MSQLTAAHALLVPAPQSGGDSGPATPSGDDHISPGGIIQLEELEMNDDRLALSAEVPRAGRPRSARDIFVVHGRDEDLRTRFFDFLRALDLRPMDWESIVAVTRETAPTLLTVIRAALARAQAIVVLLSPDDMVQLHPSLREPRESSDELEPTMQARPNVFIELGMALGGCPERTIVIEVGRLRPVADLRGLNVIHFDGGKVALGKVVQRLRLAGCEVDDSGSDWHTESRFAGVAAYDRRPVDHGQTERPRRWKIGRSES